MFRKQNLAALAVSAASRLVSELPQMRRPRKEEAQAHIGLSSHGYYYYIYNYLYVP